MNPTSMRPMIIALTHIAIASLNPPAQVGLLSPLRVCLSRISSYRMSFPNIVEIDRLISGTILLLFSIATQYAEH